MSCTSIVSPPLGCRVWNPLVLTLSLFLGIFFCVTFLILILKNLHTFLILKDTFTQKISQKIDYQEIETIDLSNGDDKFIEGQLSQLRDKNLNTILNPSKLIY